MFLNFTNHPSSLWSAEQQTAAQRYGSIQDLAFPQINPEADLSEIQTLADRYAQKILSMNPDCVLCQGEFTLCYQVITLLKQAGIPVVAACSERDTREIISDGVPKKISVFRFVQFREYEQPDSPSKEQPV